MKNIIFATSNENKMKEIRMILADLPVNILSLKEAGISADIDENGTTFEENAVIKASTIAKECNTIVLADDSGLEVDYINKEPGVYSARYMGEETSYHIKNQSIIERLDKAVGDERKARFVCVIAAALPDGRILTTRGTIEGLIGYEEKGENGFGYDPILYVPEYGMTTG
jgi:XTP/dITP diphosphohydrolase